MKKTIIIAFVILILVIGTIVGIRCFSNINGKNNAIVNEESTRNDNENLDSYTNNKTSKEDAKEESDKANGETLSSKIDDIIVLYDGFELSKLPESKTFYQLDRRLLDDNLDKYNTTYYNYSNGRFEGSSNGIIEDQVDFVAVNGVGKIAINSNYNAIPRQFEKVLNIPEKLNELYQSHMDTFQINKIDLDGDGTSEYICSYTSYIQMNGDDIDNSTITLLDGDLNVISDLVYLESDSSVKLSLDANVEYIDIDNDGTMEILINIPGYEWFTIDTFKYNNGVLQGEKEHHLEASWKHGA